MASPSHAEELAQTTSTQARDEAATSSSIGRVPQEHRKTQSNSERSENYNPETAKDVYGASWPLVTEGGAGNSSAKASNDAKLISDHPVPVLTEELFKAVLDQLKSMETLSELSKHQLIELSRIAKYVEISSTSKVEFIWSSVLQLAGLLFVVVFGVFAALAYNAADVANKQSFEANQLSLLSFCMSNPVSHFSSLGCVCSPILLNR
jgi:hypothetical protein